MQRLLLFFIVTIAFSQQRPKWVDVTPIDSDYYIGIGKALKANKEFSEYKKEANTSAFSDISSKIITAVYSESRYKATELNYDLTEQFSHQEETTTTTELEGLEDGDSPYEDGEYYYVYWRLSKAKYEQSIEKYQNRAQEYYRLSLKAKKKSAIADELKILVKVFEFILKAHDRNVKTENELLNTYVPRRIEKLISGIKVDSDNNDQVATIGKGLAKKPKYKTTVRSTKAEVPLRGLPITFEKKQGDMDMDSEEFTNDFGECETSVYRINSKEEYQSIVAFIDLKKWKTDPSRAHSVLDRKLGQITKVTKKTFEISVTSLLANEIAVKVFPNKRIDEDEIKFLNRRFITSVSKETTMPVKAYLEMQEVLDENEIEKNCTTDECKANLGHDLGVEWVLFIEIDFFKPTYNFHFERKNTRTREIQGTLDTKYTGGFNGITDSIPTWISMLWETLNKSKVTFKSEIDSNNLKQIEVFKNGEKESWKTWNKLPQDENIIAGNYKFKFTSPGYNNFETSQTVSLGKPLTVNVNMVRKKRSTALLGSIILPGLGQMYSSDDKNNLYRKKLGRIQAGVGGTFFLGSITSWLSHKKKESAYNEAYNTYMDKTTPEDVNFYREAAREKHEKMDSANTAKIVFTFLYVGWWSWSLYDTYANYPYDLGNNKFSFHIDLNEEHDFVHPTIQLSYKF